MKQSFEEKITNLLMVFPLKAKLTKEIIENSQPHNPLNCPGHNTLEKAFEENGIKAKVKGWGRTDGFVEMEGVTFTVYTKGDVDMMESRPRTVTFLIKDPWAQ